MSEGKGSCELLKASASIAGGGWGGGGCTAPVNVDLDKIATVFTTNSFRASLILALFYTSGRHKWRISYL